MFEEFGQAGEVAQRADQLAQVVEAAGGLG